MTRARTTPPPIWPVLVATAAWVVLTVLVPGTIGLTMLQLWGSSGSAPRETVLVAASLVGLGSALVGAAVALAVRRRGAIESTTPLAALTGVFAAIDVVVFAAVLIAAAVGGI